MKKLAIFTLLFLAACGGDVKGDLGLRKEGPDEFAVERKPKLEVPPSFKLRAPNPGEAPLNTENTSDTARSALLNSAEQTSTDPTTEKSEAESLLLNKLGAAEANPDIKEQLKQEYTSEDDKGVIDKLQSLSDDNMEKTLVDPEKEKERIVNNQKEGKPITEGETPAKSINHDKSVIDKILN